MAAKLDHEVTTNADFLSALVELATPVLLIGSDEHVVFANHEACAILGCRAAPQILLDELLAFGGVKGRIDLPRSSAPENTTELRLSDGRSISANARLLASGCVAITLNDISAFVREAERARADPLTGLANRLTLHSSLSHLLAEGSPVAAFCIDLDRFKAINDTLGHPVGDALLRKVAQRLGTLAAADDVVVRLGGDEFAIIKPGMHNRTDAEALAGRIVDLIGRTYVLDGHMLNIGASVGVAIAPADGDDCDTLLKNADLALYRAKADGRGRSCFFAAEMDEQMQARRALELDLRRALAFREFKLVYQPQIDLASHEVVGFEALLRWHSAERGLVSPADFIPIAEDTGLIVSIGEWVLRTACHEAVTWSRPVSIAVNLSPVQFRSAGLVQTVLSALASSGLAPDRLELEITEGALMDDTEPVVAMLRSLRALGVKVSMDDFGTGYSSLSYLQKFPFDKIKIDQSFVRGMQDNAEAGAIVRAVARLGASLGMMTTAEGVETEDQLAAIRAEGCSHVQGYLTGRPMAAEAAALLVSDAAPLKRQLRG